MDVVLPYVGLIMAVAYAIYMVYEYIRCDHLEKAFILNTKRTKENNMTSRDTPRTLSWEDVRAIETVVGREKRALVIPVKDGVVIKEIRETLIKPPGNSQTVGNLPENS